jgi:hypothetical protein
MRYLPLVLLTASTLSLCARADTIDDFVLTGESNVITFSLPASPEGNHDTCPTGIVSACIPGSQTAFYVFAPVTVNGVTADASLTFPTGSFQGGLSTSAYLAAPFFGPQLFTPDAANPTFLLGTFDLSAFYTNQFPFRTADYTLTITEETPGSATPEPATLTLLATGALGLFSLCRRKRHAG